MFEEHDKDFGSVARGPTVSFPFRFTNNTGKPVHVASVRVSCGCTSATALQTDVEPGQTGIIKASMDTRRFYGLKTVTIFVQFDRPQWDEVRLQVHANSRDDIGINPEAFALGTATHGSQPTATVSVTLGGGDQWKIEGIERDSNYIQLKAKEISRDAGGVTYQVTASLRPDTPVGKWYSDVWLKTNNPSLAKVRIPLNVEITASPTPLAAAGKVTK
jgi:hypothetical protein